VIFVTNLYVQSISGAVSRTLTNPLERLKMLKQMPVVEYKGMSTWAAFKYMAQNEGFHGFMKGNGVNVARIAPFSAFEFYFFELYKNRFLLSNPDSKMGKLFCGAMTGITASFLTYPLDLIRTHLSLAVDKGVKRSITGTAVEIIQQRGLLGLYAGLGASLFVSKTAFYTTCYFRASYHMLD
jgi:solute carrier family 25 (mitochondrial phosphate transporter), member 23/24/25/41